MKAWEVFITGWGEMRNVVASPTRNQARMYIYQSAFEAGYDVKYLEVSAKRAPTFDSFIESHRTIAHALGWSDKQESYGCLSKPS